MYTSLKNVQILISLLKQYNIRHIVISPGTREAPLAHSVETDSDFKCYSVVDERSAGYFALGLSEALNEPVCLACTSSTAACNYMPAIQEAYNRNIQLVALTADRDQYRIYQMEDQMINQVDMYRGYVQHYIDVPVVRGRREIFYCERIINEAFWVLKKEKKPIQINYRVTDIGDFSVKELPLFRKIDRIENLENTEEWEPYRQILQKRNKVLVLFGQSYSQDKEKLVKLLCKFQEKYNCVISYDYTANVQDDRLLQTVPVTETITPEDFKNYMPEIVITMGTHNWTFIKQLLAYNAGNFEHWRVFPDGRIMDMSNSIKKVFAYTAEEFIENMIENVFTQNNMEYFNLWKQKLKSIKYPDLEFSNFYAIKKLTSYIPSESILHLSILNSTRLANFFELNNSIKCFSNLGADGIDGCLSTFLGQSQVTDKLSFLIIGDLSFQYDLNAILDQLKSNQRIMIINNFAGSEFYTNFDINKVETLGKHIAADHKTVLKSAAEMADIKYLSASNMEQLETALREFVNNSEKPIVLEVFTNAEKDSEILKKFYRMNEVQAPKNNVARIKGGVKSIIRKCLMKLGIKDIKIVR